VCVLTRFDLLPEYRILVPCPSKDRNPDYRLPRSRVVVDFRPDGDIERRHDFEPPEVRRETTFGTLWI